MKMFGKYELGRLLGRGGFSEVYLCRFCAIDGFEKVLVAKIMLPNIAASPEFVDLFISEAKITAHLNHPNLVQVFDFGKVRDRYFMAMEYVKGLTISEIISRCDKKGERMPVMLALYVAQEMAKGLAYAHMAVDSRGKPLNAYHRDINPRNVFMTWDGAVKICDFGMVGILSVAEAFKGKAVGTIGYMSPEQAQGEQTGAATDIYATGLVLYHLATGRPAFDISDESRCMTAMAKADFPPPLSLLPELPREVAEIIGKATKRKPQDRYANADEMAEAISSALYGMGRITSKTAAKFMETFKEKPKPPPMPVEEPARPEPAPQDIPPRKVPPPPPKPKLLEVLYFFLVRGNKEPLGPLSLEEVKAKLETGELTGFEKASSDGAKWMKWQYFTDLAVLLGDPDRRRSSKPSSEALVVFSDAAAGAKYSEFLRRKGFTVIRASSVAEAAEAALLQRPDALLTDVVTAGAGGFEMLKVLRADPQTAAIPVVLVSPFGERAVWSRGFRYGAADIVPSTMEPEMVAERLQSVIDGVPFRAAGEAGKLIPGLLDDIIANIQKIRLSGFLKVSGGGLDGQMVFDQGEAIDARAGSLTREEAIGAMLAVTQGTYSFEEFSGRSMAVAPAEIDAVPGELALSEDRPLLWAEQEPGQPFMFKPCGGVPDLLIQPVPFDERLPETAANLRPCAVAIASLDTRSAAMKSAFRKDRRLLEIPIILVSPILLEGRETGPDRGLGMSPAAERIFANTLMKTLSPTWTLKRMLGNGAVTHSGRMQDVGAATLLETLSGRGFTGGVRFRGPMGEVSVGLDRGGPVWAFASGVVKAIGREAFSSLFYWRAGDFTVTARKLVELPNLQCGMTGLLDDVFDEVNRRAAVASTRISTDVPLRLSRPMDDEDLEVLSDNIKLVVALADEGMRPSELVPTSGLAEDECSGILATLIAMGAAV